MPGIRRVIWVNSERGFGGGIDGIRLTGIERVFRVGDEEVVLVFLPDVADVGQAVDVADQSLSTLAKPPPEV